MNGWRETPHYELQSHRSGVLNVADVMSTCTHTPLLYQHRHAVGAVAATSTQINLRFKACVLFHEGVLCLICISSSCCCFRQCTAAPCEELDNNSSTSILSTAGDTEQKQQLEQHKLQKNLTSNSITRQETAMQHTCTVVAPQRCVLCGHVQCVWAGIAGVCLISSSGTGTAIL